MLLIRIQTTRVGGSRWDTIPDPWTRVVWRPADVDVRWLERIVDFWVGQDGVFPITQWAKNSTFWGRDLQNRTPKNRTVSNQRFQFRFSFRFRCHRKISISILGGRSALRRIDKRVAIEFLPRVRERETGDGGGIERERGGDGERQRI